MKSGKEFTYKQPKTTDSYRKGWEKDFTKPRIKELCKSYKTKTTEQKQPSLDNQSKKH